MKTNPMIMSKIPELSITGMF